MRWLYTLAKKYMNVYYDDLSRLKFTCMDSSKNGWMLVNQKCDALLSLYPKEWMVTETAGDTAYLINAYQTMRSLEPWWKLVASSKLMLPILYQKFPNSPYLLPSFFTGQQMLKSGADYRKYVSKPAYGREGAGIYIGSNYTSAEAFIDASERAFGNNEMMGTNIYQEYVDMPVL